MGALSLVLATALAAPVASAESGRDFHWSGNVASGTTLSISDVNGKIVATHAASRAADVRARIHSNDDSDLKDVNVVMKQWAGHVAFCAVYSGQTVDDKCSVSGSHTDMKTHETVDFTVTVPDGVPLDAKTVNGAVSATGLN
ncbi:MAG: hypothetical protein GIW95_00390 [Candidatus Eremiobacteraeota bacterium]|nr:hypothetical protein [Candidatus Eremiobacteraeota bacterium]